MFHQSIDANGVHLRHGSRALFLHFTKAEVMQIAPVEYRSVIKFLVLKNIPTQEILKELQLVYKEQCPGKSTVYYWIAEFKGGRQDVQQDFSRVGRPQEIPEMKISQCDDIIAENRRITIRSLSSLLNVSYGTCADIIKSLGYSKVCSRFVPRFFTPEMRIRRVECAEKALELYGNYQDVFLHNIVTEDETPLSLYLPSSKRESAQWKKKEEQTPKKLRSGTVHKRELMLSVFWDSKGIVLLDFLEKKRTMNSDYYCNLLESAQTRRRKPRNSPLWLLHDNAPIHTSQKTVDTLNKAGFEIIAHPPYSPDMAPSDFYLFQHLKKHLRGRKFEDADELRNSVEEWFEMKPPEFFSCAFEQLLKRWRSVVDARGSYIE